jgi:hypothetical protein
MGDTSNPNDVIVTVRRQWNDWREATYRLSDIRGLHWTNLSGGVNAAAPKAFIHGYVWCDRMIAGELAHSCEHGKGPHEIKVCLVKKANKAIWPQILAAME